MRKDALEALFGADRNKAKKEDVTSLRGDTSLTSHQASELETETAMKITVWNRDPEDFIENELDKDDPRRPLLVLLHHAVKKKHAKSEQQANPPVITESNRTIMDADVPLKPPSTPDVAGTILDAANLADFLAKAPKPVRRTIGDPTQTRQERSQELGKRNRGGGNQNQNQQSDRDDRPKQLLPVIVDHETQQAVILGSAVWASNRDSVLHAYKSFRSADPIIKTQGEARLERARQLSNSFMAGQNGPSNRLFGKALEALLNALKNGLLESDPIEFHRLFWRP